MKKHGNGKSTIMIKGQWENHLPNIWRINTWSKPIVKSDGNHHVCRFMCVVRVPNRQHHLVKFSHARSNCLGEELWEFINSLLYRHVGAEGNRKKQEKQIIQGRNLKEHSENDILTGSKRSRLQRPRSTSHPAFSLMAIWTSAADVVWRPRNSLEVY